MSCVLPPPRLQGLRACLGTGRGFYTQMSTPEDLQLPGSLRHPSPAPAAADCVLCPGQICVPVESSSPLVTSNQKEVLRCFTVLGTWAAPSVSSGAHHPDVHPPRWAWGVQAASREQDSLDEHLPAACCSPDRLLAFLLPKLDTSNERTRVGTLQVLRHVINTAGECLVEWRWDRPAVSIFGMKRSILL